MSDPQQEQSVEDQTSTDADGAADAERRASAGIDEQHLPGYSQRTALGWFVAVALVVVAAVGAVLLVGSSSQPTRITLTPPFKFCSPTPPCLQPWADETLVVTTSRGAAVFKRQLTELPRKGSTYTATVSLVQKRSYQAYLTFRLAGKPYRSETVAFIPRKRQATLVFSNGATPAAP